MQESNITIAFVVFKPKISLLETLILKFYDKYPIIILNNSEEQLDSFLYDYKNVKIIDLKKNIGNGAGINYCLKICNTNIVIYMDIDVEFNNKNFTKLLKYSKKINNFGVLVPNSKKGVKSKITKRWDVEGAILLFNKKNLQNMRFDEKFFLYFEENDLFFNCLKNKINVIFLPKVTYVHRRATSVDEKKLQKPNKLKQLREWHYMWSYYYFYKKNFGVLFSLKKSFKLFFNDCLMFFFYLITLNYNSMFLRYSRISGLLTSIMNLKAIKRLKK
tara:strand:- start:517 stop:1338 length:822 start_codon:yes stop_codon:yes gene_type:complete